MKKQRNNIDNSKNTTKRGKTTSKKSNREPNDFYPTPAWVVHELLKRESFTGNIWECACGEGDISDVLKENGYEVISTDLIDRGYGKQEDFFESNLIADNIVTNPPYKYALDFLLKAKKHSRKKIAMFLRLQWCESSKRYSMFLDTEYPLKTVYIFSRRVSLYKGGIKTKNPGTTCYAWFVWDKSYVGKPYIDFIK